MSPSILRRCACVIQLGVAAVALSASAAAAPPARVQHSIALDFIAAPGTLPARLCVLHAAPPASGQRVCLDRATREASLETSKDGATCIVKPEHASVNWSDAQVLAALGAMFPGDDANTPCGASSRACVPRFELPSGDDPYITCASNTDPSTEGNQVVIVDLSANGAIAVEQVELRGPVARLVLAADAGAAASLSGRVAGGHYASTAASPATAGRIRLPLEPLCSTRDVVLPSLGTRTDGTREARARITFDDGAGKQIQCVRPWQWRMRMMIPTGRAGVEKQIHVALDAAGSGSTPAPTLELGTRWNGLRAPATIDLKPEAISFAWEGGCEYTAPSCPAVSLPDAGLQCTATRQEGTAPLRCAYRCLPSAERARGMSLPTTARFQGGPNEGQWTATLSYAGEVLSAGPDPQTRSVPVRFAWDDADGSFATRAGDSIDQLEVTTPTGKTHRVVPGADARITLPGARCGDAFQVRYVGDRSFDQDVARIEDGWLVVPDPKRKAKRVQIGGLLGGGFILPANPVLPAPEGIDARAYGTVQLAVRIQPGPRDNDNVLGFIPVPRAYELQLSYLIAQQPYFPVHAPDQEVQSKAEYAAFNRYAFEIVPVWQLSDRTQLGLGAGVGLGFPVRTIDEPRVGNSRLFVIPFTALARFHVSKAVALEGTFRLLGPENVYSYEPSPFFAGTPERSSDTLWSTMLGLVGIRFWL